MWVLLYWLMFFYLVIENLYLRFERDELRADNLAAWNQRWDAIVEAAKFERQFKYWKYRCLAKERIESPMKKRKKENDGA